jgi:hypothetical protein
MTYPLCVDILPMEYVDQSLVTTENDVELTKHPQCTASITRGISKEHEDRCDYASSICTSENCPEKLLRKGTTAILDPHG